MFWKFQNVPEPAFNNYCDGLHESWSRRHTTACEAFWFTAICQLLDSKHLTTYVLLDLKSGDWERKKEENRGKKDKEKVGASFPSSFNKNLFHLL